MSEIKTQTVVVNQSQKVMFKEKQNINLTSSQQRTVKIEEQAELKEQSKTLKAQLQEVKQGAADTRRISQINPYAGYFPIFYKKEIKNAMIVFVLWTMILLATLGGVATGIYFIIQNSKTDNGVSPYLCLLFIPVVILVMSL
jgi:hypothetical protein